MTIAHLALIAVLLGCLTAKSAGAFFDGGYCCGKGDDEFIRLVDDSFRFFHANTRTQNISMLYNADENALVEGPMWGMWWIQNSYGPTLCALPFLQEPWLTALQNANDFWFKHQGDGKSTDNLGLAAPDGCLVDAAWSTGSYHRQGDGDWAHHDWGLEFTAAGVVLQAELLLISRDLDAAKRYLPHLERACNFLETTRDPKNNLFLAGPAANLLAPSCGGVKQPDGTFGKGYLAGLSVTYVGACERVAELYRLVGDGNKASVYDERARITRASLRLLTTPEGYLVKMMELDGTRHGVLGQEKYGYFEAVANIDAIALRAVGDGQASRIYWKIASIPELRPHGFLITNYPGLDDMYVSWGTTDAPGIWKFGHWVNGGVWATVEARAIMAYYRLGKFEDVRRSALAARKFTDNFQMDAPLTDFGGDIWFKDRQTNLCYDALGIPAATIRGLFEYVYKADTLTLYPQVPPTVTEYHQDVPIRWGDKRIYIVIANGGRFVRSATVNGRPVPIDSRDRVTLRYADVPANARVVIKTAGAGCRDDGPELAIKARVGEAVFQTMAELPAHMAAAQAELQAAAMRVQGRPGFDYERAFLREALQAFEAYRFRLPPAGNEPADAKSAAIAKDYENAAMAMYSGFTKHIAPHLPAK